MSLLYVLAEDTQVTPYIFMMAGGMLIIIVLVMNIRRRVGRSDTSYLTPREKIERMKQDRAMQNDLRALMVEVEDLTRRFAAQLDARTVKLESLLEEAEAKIRQLERLTGQSADGPSDEPVLATRPGERDAATVEAMPGVDVARAHNDPLTHRVYALADAGRNSVEIAQQLDEQIGKVELILALRQA